MLNIYEYLFYRHYSWNLNRGWTEKDAPLTNSIVVVSLVMLFNVSTILLLIFRDISKKYLLMYVLLSLGIYYFNEYWIVKKGRIRSLSDKYNEIPQWKKIRYNLYLAIFVLLTISLPVAILIMIRDGVL